MMPRYTVGHGRTRGGSKSASRSDEDGALPQGQEELYLLHLEGGWPGLVLRGPPTAPPFSLPRWPAALVIGGSEGPVLVGHQSVTASPLLVIPTRPRVPP